jgi:nicotinamidase-related amidase
MKTAMDNASRLMKARHAAGVSIFFAKDNHRADNAASNVLLISKPASWTISLFA